MARSVWDNEGNIRDDLTEREITHKVVKWVALLVIAGLVATFGSWGLGIVTAPWVGRQNIHRIINDPSNQIFQYQHFFELNADIQTDHGNIVTLNDQFVLYLKQHPVGTPDPTGVIAQTEAELQQQISGNSTLCESLINEYNNNAREYTKAQFLSRSLPQQESPAQCSIPTSTTTGGQ